MLHLGVAFRWSTQHESGIQDQEIGDDDPGLRSHIARNDGLGYGAEVSVG